jgi:hypothetical protein
MDHDCHYRNFARRGFVDEMNFHVGMLAVDGMFAGYMDMKLL